jgi:hypothetical protein
MTEILSASNKRNHVVTDDEQQLTSIYSDSLVSSLYNNNNKHTNTLQDLDLAQGLIQLLIRNNFTVDSLRNTSSSELSKTLGIDQEVTAIMCAAANKKNNKHRKTHSSHRT